MSTAAVGADETSPLLAASASGPVPSLNPGAACEAESGGVEADEANGTAVGARRLAHNMAIIFPALSIGIFLSAADQTIVLVSYATISSELDALNLASWIMTAYTLAQASFQPLYGKLSDIFGRKQCLLVGYIVFAAGCLACGLARSIEEMIAARVVQAIGGAGMGTIVSILLTGLVPAKDRGVWQGVVNVVYAIGASLGGPLGGLLAGSIGWRWSFFGQVPLCLFAFFMVSWVLENDAGHVRDERAEEPLSMKLQRIDFLGSGALVIAIASFMLGLDRGSNVSWVVPATWISFIVSAVAAGSFLHIESNVAKEPIVPPSVCFSFELLPVYMSSFFCFFGIIAMEYALPLYYQAKDNMTPQQASFYLLPAIMTSVVSALLTGFWMRRTGQYYWALLLAFSLQSAGALVAFLVSSPAIHFTGGLVIAQVITELGVGNAVVSGLIAVIANASETSVAVVTAAYYSFRTLGSVLGVSMVSTVVQIALRTFLTIELQPYNVDVGEIVDEVRKSLDSVNTLDPEIAFIVRECYGKAIRRGLLLIFVAAMCACVTATRICGGKTSRK